MGLLNKDGVELKELWQDGIKSYLGILINGFPNAFMVYSPHGTKRSLMFTGIVHSDPLILLSL